jgi:hypothetical protein
VSLTEMSTSLWSFEPPSRVLVVSNETRDMRETIEILEDTRHSLGGSPEKISELLFPTNDVVL